MDDRWLSVDETAEHLRVSKDTVASGACGRPCVTTARTTDVVRGTLIATSRFSKGTEEAAFAGGATPITLIDGDKLIDLLIEHGIGVRKRTLEVLAVDPDAFADLDTEA